MTTPTPAQIEAARSALRNFNVLVGYIPMESALTAAAEVGEQAEVERLRPLNAELVAALEKIANHRIDSELASKEKRSMARAALAAAAEVGEPDKTIWISTEGAMKERQHTIERCAQVAETMSSYYGAVGCASIAAAIRALKEET